MNLQATCLVMWVAASLLTNTACGTYGGAPRQTSEGARAVSPGDVMDFDVLYTRNCAGCHGTDGKGGAAIGLASPVYLTIADDATIRRVTADGVQSTAMPAFAQRSGGMLSDRQIDVIIHGMRTRWARANTLGGGEVPPYASQTPGDANQGAAVYQTFCSSCHGAAGEGGPRGSSIVDGAYLGLVSDQSLRTSVIVGRPEWGAPDWRGDVPGKPMSPAEISDVVAWLAAHRPEFPGQPYSSALQRAGGVR